MIILTIDNKTQLINANGREHHMVRAKKTKALRSLAKTAAEGLPPFTNHVWVRVYIEWSPLSRKRDAANLAPTLKACLDGFTDAGLWPDDNDEFVTGPHAYATRENTVKGHTILRFEFEEYLSRSDVPGAPTTGTCV